MKEKRIEFDLWNEIKKTNRQHESLIKLCIPPKTGENRELDFKILRKWMQVLIDFPEIRRYIKALEGQQNIEDVITLGIKQSIYNGWRKTVKSYKLEKFIELFDPLICAKLKLKKPQTDWIEDNCRLLTPWHSVDDFVLMPVDSRKTFSLNIQALYKSYCCAVNGDNDSHLATLYLDVDLYNIRKNIKKETGCERILHDFYDWVKLNPTSFLKGFGSQVSVIEIIRRTMELFLAGYEMEKFIELMVMGNYPIAFTWDQKRLVVMCAE